jgi:response regulator NasT
VGTIRAGLAQAEPRSADRRRDLRLPDVITASQPDLVIIASESAARDTIEHVCVSTQHAPRPIVLFTDNDDAQRIKAALSAGITAYIVDGLRAERVKTSSMWRTPASSWTSSYAPNSTPPSSSWPSARRWSAPRAC